MSLNSVALAALAHSRVRRTQPAPWRVLDSSFLNFDVSPFAMDHGSSPISFSSCHVSLEIGRSGHDQQEDDRRPGKRRTGLAVHPAPACGQSEVRDEVISRGGRYRVVHPEREFGDDPSPLDVKEVWVGDHRYIVCRNQDEARKDAADREAIVASLREQELQARLEKRGTTSNGRMSSRTWVSCMPPRSSRRASGFY